jgi:hypothetical protein
MPAASDSTERSSDNVNVSDGEEEGFPIPPNTGQSQEVELSHSPYNTKEFDDEGDISDSEAGVCTQRGIQEQIWTSRTRSVVQANAEVTPLAEADVVSDMVRHSLTAANAHC